MYRVYLGNLDEQVSEQVLQKVFTEQNIAINGVLIKRGYGFVDCPDQTTFDQAIDKLNGYNLMGSVLQVEPSTVSKRRKSNRVQIHNLPASSTKDDVQELVAAFGTVQRCDLACRSMDASVTVVYETVEQAQQAVDHLNNLEHQGSILRAEFTNNSTSRNRIVIGDSSCTSSRDYALRILVPGEYIGALIGKKGLTIRKITSESKARIDIHGKDNVCLMEKVVSITGPAAESVTTACKEILALMQQEATANGRGEVMLKIVADNLCCGRIIGREGRMIKRLREQTDTQITVSSTEEMPTVYPDRVIVIRGTLENMSRAEVAMSKIMSTCGNRDLRSSSGIQSRLPTTASVAATAVHSASSSSVVPTTYRYSMPTSVRTVASYTGLCSSMSQGRFSPNALVADVLQIHVPTASVGGIIGSGGSNIKNIMRQSGAFVTVAPKIDLSDGSEQPTERVVTIKGSPEACWKASYFIYEKLKVDGFAGRDEVRLKTAIKVPQSSVGRLIGKGGKTVRELQNQTGCIIKLEPSTSTATDSGGDKKTPKRTVDGDVESDTYIQVYGNFINTQLMEVDILPSDPALQMLTIKEIKHAVIGNRNQKEKYVQNQIVPRLLEFMSESTKSVELKVESAIVLGSLAKGPNHMAQCIVDAGALPILVQDIQHSDIRYSDACLRCLRTLVCRRPAQYLDTIFSDASLVPYLVGIIDRSACTQECVATIIANCCMTREHQAVVCASGAVTTLANLLYRSSGNHTIQLPVLRCLAVICYKNQAVAGEVAKAVCGSEPIVNAVSLLLSRQHSTEMQMAAAKFLTHMCRAGAIHASNPIIAYKTLPTLVRQCKSDRKWEERVEGAETLAYLIEVDVQLQNIAAISDHLIATLAEYFKYPGSPPDVNLMPTIKDDITVGNELRQAAFRAYASLCANNEDVRKQVIDTKSLMGHIVNGLSDLVSKVQIAAIRCLHSLSRSVHQLRTSFQDHEVWKPIRPILLNTNDETQLLAVTSITCNLLLEFSPGKEYMLQDTQAMIDRLVDLTRHSHAGIRLNAIWALMNATFRCDQELRVQVMISLDRDDNLFRLLSDAEVDIVMKTLGLLRNLLSSQTHVDSMMRLPIIAAVIMTLEAGRPTIVKEQALCILTNIASGKTAKEFIMGNDDLIGKIVSYLQHSSVCLQIAASLCITNLVRKTDEGFAGRQQKLCEIGVDKLLQSLQSASDSNLVEVVKLALQQFSA